MYVLQQTNKYSRPRGGCGTYKVSHSAGSKQQRNCTAFCLFLCYVLLQRCHNLSDCPSFHLCADSTTSHTFVPYFQDLNPWLDFRWICGQIINSGSRPCRSDVTGKIVREWWHLFLSNSCFSSHNKYRTTKGETKLTSCLFNMQCT